MTTITPKDLLQGNVPIPYFTFSGPPAREITMRESRGEPLYIHVGNVVEQYPPGNLTVARLNIHITVFIDYLKESWSADQQPLVSAYIIDGNFYLHKIIELVWLSDREGILILGNEEFSFIEAWISGDNTD